MGSLLPKGLYIFYTSTRLNLLNPWNFWGRDPRKPVKLSHNQQNARAAAAPAAPGAATATAAAFAWECQTDIARQITALPSCLAKKPHASRGIIRERQGQT